LKISSKALRVEQDRINSRHNRVGLFLVSNMSEALSISILPQARKYPRTKKDLLNNHEVEALAVGERQARVPVIIVRQPADVNP